MTGPDDAPFDPSDPTRPARAPKPRDAATLILIKDAARAPKVLMGQRAKGHVFMPDKWVFPGGRVDPGDARAGAASELSPADEALISLGTRRAPRAFALAAVRETWEETGLKVGGVAGPSLADLAFICRAITPPYRPRRFDAHFFLAEAEAVLANDRPVAGPELLHTEWFPMAAALALDLPNVTRFVLGEVAARLAGERPAPPFLRWTRTGHRMDRLVLSCPT